jgi:hypothetical protein
MDTPLPSLPGWSVDPRLTPGTGSSTPVYLEWLIDTMTILAAAETYLLITRLTRWDLDAYQDWLATTWTCLAGSRNGIPDQA